MDLNNWKKDMSSFYPAYMMFIEEFIAADISMLGEYMQNIQSILQTVLESGQDPQFFSLANRVVVLADLKALRESGLLSTIMIAILKALYACINSEETKTAGKLIIRSSLARGAILFFSLCITKFSFEEFIQDVIQDDIDKLFRLAMLLETISEFSTSLLLKKRI